MIYRTVKTPRGWCGIVGEEGAVCRTFLPARTRSRSEALIRREFPSARHSHRAFPEVARQLQRYFAGERVCWNAAAVAPQGTKFQRNVWRAAMEIPYGETRSYGWIAKRIGAARASRAVGNAMGRNPIPPIVPCHRVVRSDGSLGGFSAPEGTRLKKRLLALEGA